MDKQEMSQLEAIKTRKKRSVLRKIVKFPAVPMRGLWEQATMEEQNLAQQRAQVIMDYWIGRKTKAQATAELKLKPVRFWQLTDQAVKGLTVGLLWQPRKRGMKMLSADQAEIMRLKKQIVDLENLLRTQQKLIEIVKSLPGRTGDDVVKLQRARSAKAEVRSLAEESPKG